MGGKALAYLAKILVVPKNRTITSMRLPFVGHLANGAKVILTYSAAMHGLEYDKYIEMVCDLQMSARYINTGTFAPKLGDYKYVDDFSSLQAYVEAQFALTNEPVRVALDTETVGLDPLAPGARLVSIQMSAKKGTAEVVYFMNKEDEFMSLCPGQPIHKQLEFFLTSEKVKLRAANGKYDFNWLRYRAHINCTNFKLDTMLVGSLLDENRSNSLKLHVRQYTSLGGYEDSLDKKYDKARMDLVPKADLLTYAGGDADGCLQVAQHMEDKLLQDPKLTRFYTRILHPAARAYEMVEKGGVCVDVPAYEALEHDLKVEQARLHKEAIAIIGGRLRAKHSDNLNLTKASLLKDLFFTPSGFNLTPKMYTAKAPSEKLMSPADKVAYASTSMDHLKMFAGDERAAPFLKALGEYQVCQKMLTTYVAKRDDDGKIIGGFLSHLRSDGRFHPSYFLAKGDTEDGESEGGTNTGRTSCKDPAFQTIPKRGEWAKRLRKCIVAPPGYVIVAHDYSQGELKIAACLANEERMIEAYRNGIDLHAITAARLSGWDFEDFMKLEAIDPKKFEEIRYLGKAGNFGLIYGMGAVPGFQNYALWNYGVSMSDEECQEARANFFELYPGLIKWHETYKKLAKMNKFVRSPLGRLRHLPLVESQDNQTASKTLRQAVNSPVQGTLSDMTLWATALFWKAGWLDHTPSIGMIHDQNLCYVPEEEAIQVAARNKFVMENLPFNTLGWDPQLKFTVDAEMGPTLGELKKIKGLQYEQAEKWHKIAMAAVQG